jgi:hypothetical protein
MLTITINGEELWNEITESFEIASENTIILELEHSLVSLSKWESKFEKPFLGKTKKDEKTTEETLEYIRLMILTPNVPPDIFSKFNQTHINEINNYIDSKQSATTFGTMPKQKRGSGEIVTAELIYYWMVAFNIPFECETWHLNRLFSLVRICNMKNSKPEKMSAHALAQRNRELNDQRRAELNTSG